MSIKQEWKNTVIINGHIYTLLIHKTEEEINRIKNSCGYGPGMCECGCGQKTNICNHTSKRDGVIKGMPMRFVQGHQNRQEYNSNWKGGKVFSATGAVRISSPKHHRAHVHTGYVFEHILIAEKALGKQLPPKAVVHHIAGNPGNNANDNLVVCQDDSYHFLLHARARAKESCGRANWRKCDICGKYDTVENLYIPPSVYGGRHRSCSAKMQRNRRAAKERSK